MILEAMYNSKIRACLAESSVRHVGKSVILENSAPSEGRKLMTFWLEDKIFLTRNLFEHFGKSITTLNQVASLSTPLYLWTSKF